MGANNKPVSSLLLKSQIGKPMMMKNQTGTWSNEIVKCYYTPNVVEDNMISQKITQGKPLTTSNVSNGSNMLSSKNMPSELVRQGAVGAYKPQQLASNVMHTIQEEPYTPESARYSEHYQSLRNSENPTPSTFTAYNSGHPGPRSQSHKSPLVLNSTANTTGPTTPHKYQSTKTYSSTPTGGQHTISYTSHGNTQSHRDPYQVEQGIAHSHSQPSVLKYTPGSTGNLSGGYAAPPRGLHAQGLAHSQMHPQPTQNVTGNYSSGSYSTNTFSRPAGQAVNAPPVNHSTTTSSGNRPAGPGLSLRSNR